MEFLGLVDRLVDRVRTAIQACPDQMEHRENVESLFLSITFVFHQDEQE